MPILSLLPPLPWLDASRWPFGLVGHIKVRWRLANVAEVADLPTCRCCSHGIAAICWICSSKLMFLEILSCLLCWQCVHQKKKKKKLMANSLEQHATVMEIIMVQVKQAEKLEPGPGTNLKFQSSKIQLIIGLKQTNKHFLSSPPLRQLDLSFSPSFRIPTMLLEQRQRQR